MLHGCFLIPACSCCHCAPYHTISHHVQYSTIKVLWDKVP
jgi:hypothetical protein